MANDPWSRAPDTKATLEHAHQCSLFQWANMAANFGLTASLDPKSYNFTGHAHRIWANEGFHDCILPLSRMFAIHNQGHGDAIRGAKAKAEGVKEGVPDVLLPVPINGHHGLFIELKRIGEKPSQAQVEFAIYLRSVGFVVEFCEGWQAARNAILDYLGVRCPSDGGAPNFEDGATRLK